MAQELRSHPVPLRSRQQHHNNDQDNTEIILRYGVGICLGITAFKWLKHNVRKVPIVGPLIAGVMPAMLLGTVAGIAVVYGLHENDAFAVQHANLPSSRQLKVVQTVHKPANTKLHQAPQQRAQAKPSHNQARAAAQQSNGADVQQLLDEAGAGFQQMLGAAENGLQNVWYATHDTATTMQAAVTAAAAVAEKELEHGRISASSAKDVDRELARFMYKTQPQRYEFQRVFEQTKHQLQQERLRVAPARTGLEHAAEDAAMTMQAAVAAAAAVAEKELKHGRRMSARDVEGEVARFMYETQPQRYEFQRVFEQTKRKLQQQQRR